MRALLIIWYDGKCRDDEWMYGIENDEYDGDEYVGMCGMNVEMHGMGMNIGMDMNNMEIYGMKAGMHGMDMT